MPFQIVRNDITEMRVDAIVNAANTALRAGGGVCGVIFRRAGFGEMQAACDAIGHCPVGGAVITPGFALPAKYVIHACGPVWQGGAKGEPELLRSCYRSALELARSRGLESVAFPLISAGIYGYPRREAMSVAVSAIGEFLLDCDMQVTLVIFEREAFELGGKLQASIQAFIDDRYVEAHAMPRARRIAQEERQLANLDAQRCAEALSEAFADSGCEDLSNFAGVWEPNFAPAAPQPAMSGSLEDALARVGESFSQRLFRLIDERGLTDPQVYKRANLDRKLFSKIRTRPDYRPGKNTVLALCIALRLNLEQTEDLLRSAGLALSPGSKADLIVEYFIRHRNYDVFAINEALFAFDQELLGAKV